MNAEHDAWGLLVSAGVVPGGLSTEDLERYTRRYLSAMQRLNRLFEFIREGFREVQHGQNAPAVRQRPNDGRPLPYPGIPDPDHPDPDNVSHFKWVLMTLYFMSRPGLELSVAQVATLADLDEDTVKVMLDGLSYGKGVNRLAVTWVLCRELLLGGMSLPVLLVRLEQWGDWAPDGVADPAFWLERGQVRIQARSDDLDKRLIGNDE